MDIRPYASQFAYDLDAEQKRFNELNAVYGENKLIADGFELQTLVALSHFPRLRQVAVTFDTGSRPPRLTTRARLSGLIRRRRSWRFRISVPSAGRAGGPRDDGRIRPSHFPFDSQIALLARELAHVEEYLERGMAWAATRRLCVVSRSCREAFERSADRRVVDYGLGWQLYGAYRYAWDMARSVDGGSARHLSVYMTPREVLAYMDQIGYEVPREMLEAEPTYRSRPAK